MYCLPTIHKTPIGERFIVASKYCGTKPLSDVTSKVFKTTFNHVESFHRSLFYTCFEKFWVVENSFSFVTKLKKINTKKKAKSISTFDFTTSGPILESKGMRAIFQKRGKKGKIFENLGKNVPNLKIF